MTTPPGTVAWAALLLLAVASTPAVAQQWRFAGIENNERVAVDVDRPMDPQERLISGVVLSVPLRPRINGTEYSLSIAEYDCEQRTRRVRHRTVWSTLRDPVRTDQSAARPVPDRSNRAIARQLDLVCAPADQRRPSPGDYDSISAFVEDTAGR